MSQGALAPRDQALVEVMLSVIRHQLRNKAASIGNAAYYLQRRAQGTELWRSDARVPQLFSLIRDELDGMEEVMRATSGAVDRAATRGLLDEMLALMAGSGGVASCAAAEGVELRAALPAATTVHDGAVVLLLTKNLAERLGGSAALEEHDGGRAVIVRLPVGEGP